MRRLLFIAAFAISGCASTQTVLKKAPTETFHSAKTPAAVAFCIANKNNVPSLDAPDGAKVIQIKNNYGAVGMIFSVYPEGAGSRIEFRKQIPIGIAAHKQCY